MNAATLSDAQLAEYDEQGFLVLRGLFEESELEVWRNRFADIVNGEVEPAEDMLVMRDVMVAKGAVVPSCPAEAIAKIQDFHNDPVLFEGFVKHPKILELAAQFTGPDIKSIHTMLINKPPGVDGRHPLHQDLLYFPFRPENDIVGISTALEPCKRENGCLVAIPGSHKTSLLPHENPEWEWLNLGYFGVRGEDGAERVHLEMNPGDTVVFHPLLLHGSGRNRTKGFRRMILVHCASARCQYLEGAHPLAGRRPYMLMQGESHEGCI
ncbi:MAG: phytanoyl-CoA dioxygenase family protein [Deltaproteobacteria bacterium]|nr:phytanoyl-CoA dioxygenase family protein [Deltaproteobacteria bacterium]MBW2445401.1 phytanoyl-CoA dioxygenase family protein [Deltaproteobacteria bacterium]